MIARSITNKSFIRTHPVQTVLTVLGLNGVLLIFLPFAARNREVYIPAVVFIEELPLSLPPFVFFGALSWWLAPFVLVPSAISAGYLRWLRIGQLSRGEEIAGYVFALLAACSIVLVEIADMVLRYQPVEIGDFYALIIFGAGALFVIQNARSTVSPVPNSLVAMQVAYLPFAIVWILLVVIEDPRPLVGWYLAVVTVLAYSVQIVLAAERPWQTLIFFAPLALAWGLLIWVA